VGLRGGVVHEFHDLLDEEGSGIAQGCGCRTQNTADYQWQSHQLEEYDHPERPILH
jgi:hypothetical protein